MLADLGESASVAAMFAFEATIRRNQKKKREKQAKMVELQPPSPNIDEAGKRAVLLDANSVILSASMRPKISCMSQLSETTNGECRKKVEDEDKGKNNTDVKSYGDANRDNYVYRTKAEEYKMLADLSEFPQLAAMFEFEARMKKSRKIKVNKKKLKQRLEPGGPISSKPEKMAENLYPKHEKLVVLPDISAGKPLKNDWTCKRNTIQMSEAQKGECKKKEDYDENRNSEGVVSGGDVNKANYVYRTKAEEYKMLADLSESPELSAMFAFDARMKMKSRKRNGNSKRKKKQKVETGAPSPMIDEASKTAELLYAKPSIISAKATSQKLLVEELGENAQLFGVTPVILSENCIPQKFLKTEKMTANEGPQLVEHLISLDASVNVPVIDDRICNKSGTQSSEAQRERIEGAVEGINSNHVTRDEGMYVYRTKAEEYKMLADLSDFPQLAAMLNFEARMKDNRKRNKNKRKEKKCIINFNAQNATGCETGKNVEVLDTKPIIIPSHGMPQQLFVDGADEKKGNTHKFTVETTEEVNADNGLRSAIVVDYGLSFTGGSDGHDETVGLGNLGGLVEIEQTVALAREEQKIFEAQDNTVIMLEPEKQVKSTGDAGTVMSSEIESVERKENFVLRKLLRRPRYFDFSRSTWEICHNCGQDDHRAVECTMEKKQKPCFYCGSLGHIGKHCIQGCTCNKCKRKGHLAKYCLEGDPSNNETSEICLRCGDSGHDMFSCCNDYSPDDLKNVECYVCKKFGHLCCVDYKHEGPEVVSCYQCGQNGHFGSECTKLQKDANGSQANYFCMEGGVKDQVASKC